MILHFCVLNGNCLHFRLTKCKPPVFLSPPFFNSSCHSSSFSVQSQTSSDSLVFYRVFYFIVSRRRRSSYLWQALFGVCNLKRNEFKIFSRFFAEVDLTFKQMQNVHQVEIYSTVGDHYSSGLIYQLQNENNIIAKYGTHTS